METIEQLLEKYKRGTATDDEKQSLLNALSVNEGQLRKLLEGQFELNVQQDVQLISRQRSEQLYNQIWQKIAPAGESTLHQKTGFIRRMGAIQWLAAACVAGIMLIGGWYLFNHRGTNAKAAIAVVTKPALKTFSNSLGNSVTTTLPDGSTVTLDPGSAISYYQPFDSVKRDISLTGKAFFKVAKDPLKPFTVFANGIATTALGTEFWVDARVDTIAIQLMEGKVVVRAIDRSMAMNDVYLKPGEQLLVNKPAGTYALSTFTTGAESNKPVNRKSINHVALAFNKTPLPEVFNKIGRKYNMVVQFDASALKSLSFTGTFMINDSLQTILSIICNTNDLTFTKEDGVVVIRK
ncbi:MAG TPA: FecR domain-containing protein [Niastella sp.]